MTWGVPFAAMPAAVAVAAPNVGSATPFADALAITKTTDTNLQAVRWGRGFGWGLGAGLLGSAIAGGALAAPYYYGDPYYYSDGQPYYPPAAYGPGYYPAPGTGDNASYCASRYRSYDPATGTYLGYDGVRHPCP